MMTLHRLHSSDGLLARKGGAAPLGLSKTEIDDLVEDPGAGEAPTPAPVSEPVQLALVPGRDAADQAEAAAEPPPAASLLPFALHRTLRDQGDVWELVTPDLLARIAQAAGQGDRPEAAGGPGRAEDSAAPQDHAPQSAASAPQPAPAPLEEPRDAEEGGAPETQPALEPAPAIHGAAAVPTSPDGAEARPEMSAPDPAWRVGVDTLPHARHAGPARWLALGAAACLLIGGVAWWSFQAQTPEPEAAPEALETTGAAPGADGTGRAQTRAAGAVAPAPPVTPVPDAGPDAPPASIAPAAAASEADPATPSVDLVRIETNGDAVIAGRAAPNSELILLDNGTPIGTVEADAFGEWVFVPEGPLPQGEHVFGLVLKSVQGKVKIPAEAEPSSAPPAPGEAPAAPEDSSEAAPDKSDGAELRIEEDGLLAPVPARKPFASPRESDLGAPIPGRKPDSDAVPPVRSSAASAPSADFVVQLASVKTRDGARREWQKLRSRFPEVLSGMDLNLHETKLAQRGTVIRVRTGPFPGLSEAAEFCARIRAGRQDCLVVRTSGED